MVLGDGVLTPAQSVLGAIYGLQVKTSVSQGTEATYADLGHFSRSAIRISFLVICYPVLIVTYLGQAAWLTRYPDQVSSTFYASIPYGDGFYWVLGSVYIPEVNYVMMVLTVVVIAIFKTTVKLGNAYGVAVSSMTI
ncbi:Potassium transporter 5 [Trebouxia sp. C0009 RCD-2024]